MADLTPPPDQSFLNAALTYRWVWLIVPVFAGTAIGMGWLNGDLHQASGRNAVIFMTSFAVIVSAAVHLFCRFVPSGKKDNALFALLFSVLTICSIVAEIAELKQDGFRLEPLRERLPPFFLTLLFGTTAFGAIGSVLKRTWAGRIQFISAFLWMLLIAGVFLIADPGDRLAHKDSIMFAPWGEGARFVLPILWLGFGTLMFASGMRDPKMKDSIMSSPFIIFAWPILVIGVGGLGAIVVFAILAGLIYGISYIGFLFGHSRLITTLTVVVLIGLFIVAGFVVGRKNRNKTGAN